MIKIGITGGIGSGKSTITEIISVYGIPVYIADIESKKLTATSPIIRQGLVDLFGEDLYEGSTLNKPLLASYIFGNENNMRKVNSIIHPEVEKDFNRWLQVHEGEAIVAKEAAILFETGFNKLVDKVITVYSPLELRIERTMKRDGVSRDKVLERMQNQMPDEEKIKLSDFVIVNDGTESLIEQSLNILKQLNS